MWSGGTLYYTVQYMFLQSPTGHCGKAEYALGIKLYGSWVHSLYNAGYRRTCKFRWHTCLHPYVPIVSSVILSIYLGWNSDTDIPFKDTLRRSSELIVSPYAKAKAGFDGAAKPPDDWPCSMTRTSSMVGRSAGFSCTQTSPRWMHFITSLSVSGDWQSKNGSTASSAVPLTH